MTRQVVTLAPSRPLFEAINLFGLRRFRHIPVTEAGRLVGVLSDRDALRFFARHGGAGAAETTVGGVMSDEPITISPDASVADATRLIIEHRINCLPVVSDDQELLGILTTTDLLRALYTLQQTLQQWLEGRVVPSGSV